MKHFITTAVEMLDQKIKDICCVPPEQRSIIKDNLIHSKYDALQFNTTSLITQIELIAQKYPDHICVVDDGMNFNYYEIIQYAKSVAAFIIKNNIERQNAVGIKVKRSWRLIPIILGILYSGCYYVPLDPRNPSKRTASIASNAKMKLIIDDECFDIIIKRAATSSDYFRSTGLEALIYCIFTSGTTGEPKGVPITNQNVLSLFKACETWVKFSENDIWGLFHSYAFDFSVWEIFGALLYGGKLVIFNEEQCANPIDCMNLIQKEGVTIFNQTPSSFKNLLSCNVSWSQSIRYVFFGGEALQPSDLISWWDNYGANFKTQLVNMYGITETTIHAAYHLVDCHFNSSNIGRPLSDQGMVIVDSCNRPCAIGVPGELWLSGEGLTNGYLNDDSMTTAKFNEDSFWGLNDRFYHSGDMAMLNMHGEFIYLGRKDKQIKINGHRLESEEVIYYLKNITGVIDACIQVVSHNDFGVQTLFAYYVAENNISDMMISGKLAEHLPAYAIPTYYIRIDKIPLTVNGKIDISSLPTAIDNSKHIHQQTTSIDQSIADAWKEVLGCKIIATDKSFFELGGNSIKAMLLVKKINMLLNKTTKKNSFSIVDMFKYTTIEKQISAARKWL
jgi:amino acid adenylation domain-containing protein